MADCVRGPGQPGHPGADRKGRDTDAHGAQQSGVFRCNAIIYDCVMQLSYYLGSWIVFSKDYNPARG
ncbi:protein of unknown function [Rhodovastum atsumiense]|nr:protein of unknown function [Rhodovastum atsumiense]